MRPSDADALALDLPAAHRCVVRGAPEIDVGAFGNPVMAINENSKDDIQRYMQMMEGAQTGKLPEDVDED